MSVRNDFSQVSAVSPTASALTLQTMVSMPPSSAAAPSIQPFSAAGSATSIALPHDLTPFADSALHDVTDLVGIARADRDVGALGRKQLGDRQPNALAAAGHEHALSL